MRRKAAMFGQHKEHANTNMYFSTFATSTGNKLSLTNSSGRVQVDKGTAKRIPGQTLKNTKQIAHNTPLPR